MTSELQRIVDNLGSSLRRSVALDDRHFRLRVYSPHYGPVDDVRLASILHRRAKGPIIGWVLAHGIADAPAAIRLPSNPELALVPRVCAPVRCGGALLGYLWLVDPEELLTDAELDVVTEAANAAGIVMYREQLLEDLERAREREQLRDLFATDPAVREHAATELIDADLFVPGRGVSVIALRPVLPGVQPDEALQKSVNMALLHVRRSLMVRHSLHLGHHDRGVLLAAWQERDSERQWLADVGAQLRSAFLDSLPAGAPAWRPVIGIGDPVPALVDAVDSRRQAYQATRIAEVLDTSDVVWWADLGVYRTLVQLPAAELTGSALHPGLVRLLSTEGGAPLLESLERFLDLAGDVKATAEALMVHRTTLYYRLSRIEQLADVNLRRGGDRLVLHLGLKIARLAGLYPGEHAATMIARSDPTETASPTTTRSASPQIGASGSVFTAMTT